MAKNKKRKKAKIINMQPTLSPNKYIKSKARNLAILEVFVNNDMFNVGKGHVLFVREKRNGQKIVGIYLIDTWCLGVKNTFYLILDEFEYDEFKEKFFNQPGMVFSSCDANYACNIVYGALEYAEGLGIQPHKDFDVTEFILIDVDEVEYEELKFGDNGVPHYTSYDTDNKVAIINKLNKSVGKDGYFYTDGEFFRPSDEYIPDDELFDSEDEPDCYFEAADKYLTHIDDKAIYHLYVSILMIVKNICIKDFEGYRSLFISDQAKFLNELYSDVLGSSFKSLDLNSDDSKAIDRIILASTENYFIDEGIEFILMDENVMSFSSEMEDDFLSQLCKVNLLKSGQEKLNSLVSIAAYLMEMNEYENYKIDDIKVLFEKFLTDSANFFRGDDMLGIVFVTMRDYQDLYGKINFDAVTIEE